MNKTHLILIVLALILLGLFLFVNKSDAINDPNGNGVFFSNLFSMSTDLNSTTTSPCLVAGPSGGSVVGCFGNGFSRNYTILRAGQFPGIISSFACLIDAVSGAGSGDSITFSVVEGTPGIVNNILATSTSLTFTQGGTPNLASNTMGSSTNISRLLGAPGLALRVALTDDDGSITSVSASCYVIGKIRQ